ncbi:MAG: hypothetical protein ABIJ56_08820 [Pseudomonadota bacterium]
MREPFALVLALALCASCSGAARQPSESRVGGEAGLTGRQAAECPVLDAAKKGSWVPMSQAGAPVNIKGPPLRSFWTGSRLLVMDRSFSRPDNAAYDPCTDTWTRISPISGIPPGHGGSLHGQWVGDRLVVWYKPYNPKKSSWIVKEYWPETDTWSESAVPAAAAPVPVVGRRLVIFEGKSSTPAFENGSVHDLETGQTEDLPSQGAPIARKGYVGVVLDDNRYLVWGGRGGSPDKRDLNDGAILDLAAKKWTPMSMQGAPGGRSFAKAAWTGEKLIVWSDQYGRIEGGGVYDPAADAWSALPAENAPIARQQTLAAYGAGRFVVAGGYSSAKQAAEAKVQDNLAGAVYDVDKDRWTAVALPVAMNDIWAAVHVLDDGRMLLRHRDFQWMHLFDPRTLQWTGIDPEPIANRGFTQVALIGSRLIVWGGMQSEQGIKNPCDNVPAGMGCDPPGPAVHYLSDGAITVF